MKKALAIMIGAFLMIALFTACTQDPYDGHPSVNATITLDGRGYVLTDAERTLTVNGSEGVVLPVLKSDNSKTFLGWSLKSDGTGSDLIVLENGRYYPENNGSIMLYAVWANNQIRIYYHYNIDADNDALYGTSTVTYNPYSKISFPTNPTYVIDGMSLEFAGWSLEKAPGPNFVTRDSNVNLPISDTHYYAQWKLPITLKWVSGDEEEIIETTAYELASFPSSTPESVDGEYKFMGWFDSNGAEVTASTVLYNSQTITARFGNIVTINYNYRNDSGEWVSYTPNKTYYNYEYNSYNVPTPNGTEIPGFAGWSRAIDGELIKNTDIIPAGTKEINLYAVTGKIITIEPVGTPSGLEVENGSFGIINGETRTEIVYPRKGDFFVATALCSDPALNNVVIDENGSLADGVSLSEIPATLYAQWTSPKEIGGSIMYKNNVATTRTPIANPDSYKFYDENYNSVSLEFKYNGFVIETESTKNNPPVFYYIENDFSDTQITDISNSGYVVVYEDSYNVRTVENLRFHALGNTDPFYQLSDADKSSGVKMTEAHIEVNKDQDRTIGHYVADIRSKTSIDDWFVLGESERKYINANAEIANYLNVDLSVIPASGGHIIWLSSPSGLDKNVYYGSCLRYSSQNVNVGRFGADYPKTETAFEQYKTHTALFRMI